MRIELSLNRTSKSRMIPMDYQYYISAWVYKVLKSADQDFATFLHEHGYGESAVKLYKLFCFSRLNFGKPKLWKEKKLFEITSRNISLQLSFDVQETATHFIKGLFLSQEFYLGDRFNGIDFRVSAVQVMADPEFSETMHYRLQSPWVVSLRSEGALHSSYLRPDDDLFVQQSIYHIIEKYNNTRSETIEVGDFDLKVVGACKRAGFVLKPGSKQQSRVVGNIFDFELKAPVEVQRMIWNAGVSEKSSSGFGWVEVKDV